MTTVSTLHIAPPETLKEIGDDVRYYRVSQHVDRGEYREAADVARVMLDDGYYDIRLICYHLFGAFLDEGIAVLPEVCAELEAVLQGDLDVIGPAKKKDRAIDSTLGWLFRTVTDHVSFHATQKDATWTGWLETVDAAVVDALIAGIPRLIAAVEALSEEAQCIGQMTRLVRFCRETLARLPKRISAGQPVASSTSAAASVASQGADASPWGEPAPVGSAEDVGPQALPHAARAAVPASPPGDDAPAMQLLRRKLAAFEALMERGDFAKAAVVSHDIRGILANFDPLQYLPKLLSGYCRILSRSIEELLPYWQDIDSPQWQALEQYYRVDLDTFLTE